MPLPRNLTGAGYLKPVGAPVTCKHNEFLKGNSYANSGKLGKKSSFFAWVRAKLLGGGAYETESRGEGALRGREGEAGQRDGSQGRHGEGQTGTCQERYDGTHRQTEQVRTHCFTTLFGQQLKLSVVYYSWQKF